MARVPQIIQVDGAPPGVIPGQFAPRREGVAPGAFGEGVGRALTGLGDSVQNAGVALGREAIAAQQIQNETEATEAATRFSQGATEEYTRYSQLQGRAATDAFPEFQQRMKAMQQETITGASNPRVRRMLQARVDQQGGTILDGGLRWNLTQSREGSVNASEAAASQSVNEGILYRNDPAKRDGALAQGLSEIEKIGEVRGWDETTLRVQQAKYTGRFYTGIIQSVAENDPIAAQRLFENARSQMDAETQVRIENALAAPVRARRAAGIVAGVTQPPDAGAPGALRETVWRAEGGAAANPTPGQTARGGGITDGTWKAYAGRLGLKPEQRGSREAFNLVFDAYQADAQQQIGRPLNTGEQYAAWFLGIGGAKAFIMSPPSADARAVYGKAAGEDIAEQAFKNNGAMMRPGMTVGQVLEAISTKVSGAPRSDRGAMLQEVVRQAGGDPQLQAAAMTQFNQWSNLQDAVEAQERASMDRRVRDLGTSLEAGGLVSIPDGDIRRLYPPEQADRILDTLYTQQIGGQMFQSVQLSTPDQLRDMREGLTNGTGPLADLLRLRRGTTMNPDGTVAEQDKAGDMAARVQLGAVLDQRIQARQQALNGDPAQFVLADPGVREAATRVAADPKDAQAMAAYVTATQAAQTRLGVPEVEQRVLSKAQAQNIAGGLMQGDPAKTDVAGQLRGLRTSYGEAWPRVFQDLVRDGKLPPEYQVLGVIPSAVGQADFQGMMVAARTAGGMDKLRETIPQATRQAIERDMTTYTEGFVRTATASGQTGGTALASTVYRSVENLAMYYALQGAAPAAAMQRATDRVINDRYDIAGTTRVPKGMLPDVQQAQALVMRGMTADQLADVPGNPELTGSERRDIVFRAAKRGFWVPNERDDGLVLMMELQNGGRLPVMRADTGTRIELKFDALPKESVDGASRIVLPSLLPGAPDPAAEAPRLPPAPGARPATTPGALPPPVGAPLPGDPGAKKRGTWTRPQPQ